MTLTRSHRIKLAILIALLAVAGGRETEWARRTFGLDGYWEQEARHRAAAVWEAEVELVAIENELIDTRDPAQREALTRDRDAAAAELDDLRRALKEAEDRR